MGNLQTILESMSDSQKIEYLRKEGLLCDELLQLYYEGNASSKEIHDYVFISTATTISGNQKLNHISFSYRK